MNATKMLRPNRRRVMPPDMAANVASAPPPETGEGTAAMEELLDPVTGAPLLGAVPANVAAVLRDAFERLEEHTAREAANIKRAMSDVVFDAGNVALSLRSLAYLFLKATCDDGPNTKFGSAAHLVVDIIETMANRLEALEVRAYGATSEGPDERRKAA